MRLDQVDDEAYSFFGEPFWRYGATSVIGEAYLATEPSNVLRLRHRAYTDDVDRRVRLLVAVSDGLHCEINYGQPRKDQRDCDPEIVIHMCVVVQLSISHFPDAYDRDGGPGLLTPLVLLTN